jgi:hypothetical protein
MHPARKPELIDPDRVTATDRDDMTTLEHRNRAQQLDDALHASCEYATALWEHIDAIRRYLFESLPSDPRAPGPSPRWSASPTGPDDDEGWQSWIATYSAATSILAGPHGDSGLGLSEAKHAASARRDAPTVQLLAQTGYAKPSSPPAAAEQPAAEQPMPSPPAADARPARVPDAALRPLRAIAAGVVGALALRGLFVRSGGPSRRLR